jgi:restriction system protein
VSEQISSTPNVRLPGYFDYFKPVLETQKELGGVCKANELSDIVIDKLIRSGKFINGQSNVRPITARVYLQKARRILTKAGYMYSPQRGVWNLTEKGFTTDLSAEDLLNLDEIRKRIDKDCGKNSNRKTKSEILPRDDKKRNDQTIRINKDDPLIAFKYLKDISSEESISICERILLNSGFQKINIAAISRERYIEGDCIFEENPFLWTNVLFRLTCQKESIDANAIRGFRTEMRGRADKGIWMTINTFTMDAKWEAEREGTLPIIIIDRNKLLKMISALE